MPSKRWPSLWVQARGHRTWRPALREDDGGEPRNATISLEIGKVVGGAHDHCGVISMTDHQESGLVPIDWATVMGDRYKTACRVIKRDMPRSLRAMYDPEDFVGDAIVELMARPERFVASGSAPLVLVARRRMIDAVRSPRSRLARLESDVVDRQPAAELEQEAAELRERMLGRVDDPGEQNMIELRCSGHTLPEIAELTGVGLRTLQRFWKAFREANEPF